MANRKNNIPHSSESDEDHDNFSKSNFKMSQEGGFPNTNSSLRFPSNQPQSTFAKRYNEPSTFKQPSR